MAKDLERHAPEITQLDATILKTLDHSKQQEEESLENLAKQFNIKLPVKEMRDL